jgi:hypothetical protein
VSLLDRYLAKLTVTTGRYTQVTRWPEQGNFRTTGDIMPAVHLGYFRFLTYKVSTCLTSASRQIPRNADQTAVSFSFLHSKVLNERKTLDGIHHDVRESTNKGEQWYVRHNWFIVFLIQATCFDLYTGHLQAFITGESVIATHGGIPSCSRR